MIRRINGGGRRFGNRCFRFPVSTINPDFFNSSTGNEDEGNFFWEEISFKILIDCYFILFFIFFFFWFNNLHANLHSCYNSNFCAMKFSLLSEKRIAWFCIADSKRFFFLCMFFGMIENLKIFFFSSFLCKLNNFFSLNFVRRWISTVWEILLSLKYVYDD